MNKLFYYKLDRVANSRLIESLIAMSFLTMVFVGESYATSTCTVSKMGMDVCGPGGNGKFKCTNLFDKTCTTITTEETHSSLSCTKTGGGAMVSASNCISGPTRIGVSCTCPGGNTNLCTAFTCPYKQTVTCKGTCYVPTKENSCTSAFGCTVPTPTIPDCTPVLQCHTDPVTPTCGTVSPAACTAKPSVCTVAKVCS